MHCPYNICKLSLNELKINKHLRGVGRLSYDSPSELSNCSAEVENYVHVNTQRNIHSLKMTESCGVQPKKHKCGP